MTWKQTTTRVRHAEEETETGKSNLGRLIQMNDITLMVLILCITGLGVYVWKASNKKRAITVLVLFLVSVGAWQANEFHHRRWLHKLDMRIGQEIEQALDAKLRNLGPNDEITNRYGTFVRLTDVRIERPSYMWMLIVRLELTAIAHFEKGQINVALGIDKGASIGITRLTYCDSKPPRIEGWANHPDFYYDQ